MSGHVRLMRTSAFLREFFLVAIAATCLIGCSTTSPRSTTQCEVTPPSRTLVEKERILNVQTALEAFTARAEGASREEIHDRVETTFQELGDRDAACAMLLRVVTCLGEQRRSAQEVSEFRSFLKDTKACEPRDEALISIVNVVQVAVNDALRFKNTPLAFDVFVRNSGDRPALLSTIHVWFDEHLRPSRAPADMQRITAVYTVAVDSTGANVRGAELNSPAYAYYPNPGSPVLIVESPIAQTLGPRSTDRFRVQFNFLDDAEIRGPLEQVRVAVDFNDGEEASFKPIELVRQAPCLTIMVRNGDKWIPKQVCR